MVGSTLLPNIACGESAGSWPSASARESEGGGKIKNNASALRLPFVANQGQVDARAKFYTKTFGATLFVTQEGEMVYALPKTNDAGLGVTLTEQLVGATVKDIKGEHRSVTKVNYFKGRDLSKWQRNVPAFEAVSLGESYSGIDIKLHAYGSKVEKLFYLKPHANPDVIRVKVSGGRDLAVTQQGDLEVNTPGGAVRFSKPIAYQEIDGRKQAVSVAYALQGDEYGFSLGDYDKDKELVIDPLFISTYLGGSDLEDINAMARDRRGNIYVAGETTSSDFPVTPDAVQPTFTPGGNFESDGFVAMFNSGLTQILAATYLGGSDEDEIEGMALDRSGNVYVVGDTGSSDIPGIGPNSAVTTKGGFQQAFIVKLDSDLDEIKGATYLGGSVDSSGIAIALGPGGSVFVGGDVESPDFSGIGPNSAVNTLNGGSDGFIAKLDSNLTQIFNATFLGGSGGDEEVRKIVVSGNAVYAGGTTNSPDFSGVGPGSADSTFSGPDEGFVAKLNTSLSKITGATYLGGSDDDAVRDLLVGLRGVYAAGSTSSMDFPGITSNSAQSAPGGFDDGFVAKLDLGLHNITAATFLGGSDSDDIAAITISRGDIYVTGSTFSVSFPGVGPGSIQPSSGSPGTGNDAFVTELKANLSQFFDSTFLGGSGSDDGKAILADGSDNIYVGGDTGSADFPGTNSTSAQPALAGADDGFVAKLKD